MDLSRIRTAVVVELLAQSSRGENAVMENTSGSKYNCTCIFDENLRDVAVDPASMSASCEDLRIKLLSEQDLDSRARILAQLGSFQRILNNLSEAEDCHVQCLKLLNPHFEVIFIPMHIYIFIFDHLTDL